MRMASLDVPCKLMEPLEIDVESVQQDSVMPDATSYISLLAKYDVSRASSVEDSGFCDSRPRSSLTVTIIMSPCLTIEQARSMKRRPVRPLSDRFAKLPCLMVDENSEGCEYSAGGPLQFKSRKRKRKVGCKNKASHSPAKPAVSHHAPTKPSLVPSVKASCNDVVKSLSSSSPRLSMSALRNSKWTDDRPLPGNPPLPPTPPKPQRVQDPRMVSDKDKASSPPPPPPPPPRSPRSSSTERQSTDKSQKSLPRFVLGRSSRPLLSSTLIEDKTQVCPLMSLPVDTSVKTPRQKSSPRAPHLPLLPTPSIRPLMSVPVPPPPSPQLPPGEARRQQRYCRGQERALQSQIELLQRDLAINQRMMEITKREELQKQIQRQRELEEERANKIEDARRLERERERVRLQREQERARQLEREQDRARLQREQERARQLEREQERARLQREKEKAQQLEQERERIQRIEREKIAKQMEIEKGIQSLKQLAEEKAERERLAEREREIARQKEEVKRKELAKLREVEILKQKLWEKAAQRELEQIKQDNKHLFEGLYVKNPHGTFQGRTLLKGGVEPRNIPFVPLYVTNPIKPSGKPEIIPTDPRTKPGPKLSNAPCKDISRISEMKKAAGEMVSGSHAGKEEKDCPEKKRLVEEGKPVVPSGSTLQKGGAVNEKHSALDSKGNVELTSSKVTDTKETAATKKLAAPLVDSNNKVEKSSKTRNTKELSATEKLRAHSLDSNSKVEKSSKTRKTEETGTVKKLVAPLVDSDSKVEKSSKTRNMEETAAVKKLGAHLVDSNNNIELESSKVKNREETGTVKKLGALSVDSKGNVELKSSEVRVRKETVTAEKSGATVSEKSNDAVSLLKTDLSSTNIARVQTVGKMEKEQSKSLDSEVQSNNKQVDSKSDRQRTQATEEKLAERKKRLEEFRHEITSKETTTHRIKLNESTKRPTKDDVAQGTSQNPCDDDKTGREAYGKWIDNHEPNNDVAETYEQENTDAKESTERDSGLDYNGNFDKNLIITKVPSKSDDDIVILSEIESPHKHRKKSKKAKKSKKSKKSRHRSPSPAHSAHSENSSSTQMYISKKTDAGLKITIANVESSDRSPSLKRKHKSQASYSDEAKHRSVKRKHKRKEKKALKRKNESPGSSASDQGSPHHRHRTKKPKLDDLGSVTVTLPSQQNRSPGRSYNDDYRGASYHDLDKPIDRLRGILDGRETLGYADVCEEEGIEELEQPLVIKKHVFDAADFKNKVQAAKTVQNNNEEKQLTAEENASNIRHSVVLSHLEESMEAQSRPSSPLELGELTPTPKFKKRASKIKPRHRPDSTDKPMPRNLCDVYE